MGAIQILAVLTYLKISFTKFNLSKFVELKDGIWYYIGNRVFSIKFVIS